jgi:DNA-binding PadR family transcriptional regulator
MTDTPSGDLEVQDEILQVMYWLRGEKLADEVAARDLERFVGASELQLDGALERLALLGLVRVSPAGGTLRYALTEEGAREGGRRFADEFKDLTKPGHGECGDPDCECQQTGNIEDCRHAR